MKKYVLYYYDENKHEYVKIFYRLKSAYKFLHKIYSNIEDDWKKDFIDEFPYNKVKQKIKLFTQFTFIDDTIYHVKSIKEVEVI